MVLSVCIYLYEVFEPREHSHLKSLKSKHVSRVEFPILFRTSISCFWNVSNSSLHRPYAQWIPANVMHRAVSLHSNQKQHTQNRIQFFDCVNMTMNMWEWRKRNEMQEMNVNESVIDWLFVWLFDCLIVWLVHWFREMRGIKRRIWCDVMWYDVMRCNVMLC
jgi:hypothetical protein